MAKITDVTGKDLCVTSHSCPLDFGLVAQGSNLLPFRLSGKGKNCGGKAKVGGRFSGGKVPVNL